MDQNYGLELVRATELAALNASLHQGQGEPIELINSTRAALVRGLERITLKGEMINDRFAHVPGVDPLPGMVGCGTDEMQVSAVAVEGHEATAHGRTNAASYAAVASPGNIRLLPRVAARFIVAPQEAYGMVDLDQSASTNIRRVARALHKYTENVTVCVLDVPRHANLIREIQQCGARIKRIQAGEISAAMSVLTGKCDLFMGIGLAPDMGLIAAAIRCLGGYLEGQLVAETDKELELSQSYGLSGNEFYKVDDLVKDNQVSFVGTGVTRGQFLDGVEFTKSGAITHSFVARGESRTFRHIETTHFFDHMPVF